MIKMTAITRCYLQIDGSPAEMAMLFRRYMGVEHGVMPKHVTAQVLDTGTVCLSTFESPARAKESVKLFTAAFDDGILRSWITILDFDAYKALEAAKAAHPAGKGR